MSEIERRAPSRNTAEVRDLRLLLAVLRTETKLVRLRRALSQKYDMDQPRAPAGQSDGGRWVSGGGTGGVSADRSQGGRRASLDAADRFAEAPQRTLLDSGGEILTLRIRSGRGDWDEQHTVVTPDGDSRVFDNAGESQTIRDGQTGEVLSHSAFAMDRAAYDATVQPAFLPAALVVAPAVAATLEAAAMLLTVLAARSAGLGNEPGSIALRYDFEPDEDKKFPVVWVGPVDQRILDQFCPHSEEVQAVTDEATRRLTAANPNLDKTRLGSLIHLDIGKTFKARGYPEIKVEYSLDRASGKPARYGAGDSVRLDLYELAPDQMVCVYDPKTGKEGLRPERAVDLARIAKRNFPTSRGIIMIQVRPRP